jgi:hypothetical protein
LARRGLSERTVTLYRDTIAKALNEQLGSVKLTALTASDVHRALTALAAGMSTRTLQITHNVLVRAIRHGRSGRPRQVVRCESQHLSFGMKVFEFPNGCVVTGRNGV